MTLVAHTTSGLLLQESFADLSAWTSDGVWVAAADPSFVTFDPGPILVLSPGVSGSADYDGVREGQLFVEGTTWTLLYDAGDDTHGWLQFTATSTDGGLTWTKNGAQSIGYSDGSSGTYDATATGWIEKRGGTYYLYRVTANSVYTAPTGQGLPKGPYQGDIWTASALGGTWTFLRTLPVATGLDDSQNLTGSVVLDGTIYHHFSDCDMNGVSGVIRFSFTTIGGSWTQTAEQIFGSALSDGRRVENPKVFYHAGLSRWCMLLNLINSSGQADQTGVALSASLTDWSAATLRHIQHASPIDSPNAVGVITHVTGPDGALVQDEAGRIPAIYDGLPRGNSGAGWHLGRSLRYVVLEPAAACACYTDVTTMPRRIVRTISHGNCVVEFACEFRTIDATAGALALEFRRQNNSNYYRLVLTPGAGMRLDKVVAGSVTLLQSALLSTEKAVVNLVHRVRVQFSGTTIQAWLNGEEQINTTDSTYSSGGSVAIQATDLDGDVRLLSLRTAQTVTVTGVPSGSTLTLRGAGGFPVATATSSGGTITLTAPHYPQSTLDIGGVPYKPADGIWGGDAYTVTPNLAGASLGFG